MKRKLFTLLAAISLLLCVATVGLWVRSYRSDITLFFRWGYSGPQAAYSTMIAAGTGVIWFRHEIDHPKPDKGIIYPGMDFQIDVHGIAGLFGSRLWHGFICELRGDTKTDYVFTLSMPLAAPAVLFSIPCLLYFVGAKRRQHRIGICRSCGYDLRATPERCPECGAVPQKV